ncbi:MAG TPA: hypothetical protein VK762_00815 [Polyangiaceae bacterium]|jgi:hypothetical protein|nr:hypothetical protein [Polyangiaceae bacterium]
MPDGDMAIVQCTRYPLARAAAAPAAASPTGWEMVLAPSRVVATAEKHAQCHGMTVGGKELTFCVPVHGAAHF